MSNSCAVAKAAQTLFLSRGREAIAALMKAYDVTHLRQLPKESFHAFTLDALARAKFNPGETKVDDYKFFFVASQKRLADGTPYMRKRFATEKEAVECANKWAVASEHGGKYIVYNVVAVGESQRSEPPVKYRRIKPKAGRK